MAAADPSTRIRAPYRRREWLIPAGLILLTAIPALAGSLRLAQLSTAAPVTAENERFFASPAPVAVHIVSTTIYCVLGAFQFVPGLRRRRPGWHRGAGRLLVPTGLAAALSGLWMTIFYPKPADVGEVLTGVRIVVGVAMVAGIVGAVTAIRRGEVARHRAWMMRAYALGIGAGTQAFTAVPWVIVAGELDQAAKTLSMLAGWVVNLAVAEWVIRTRRPG